MAMSRLSRLTGAATALAALAVLGACNEEDGIVEPPAEYVAVRRAWAPGERDALIQSIVQNRSFVFPYVGDVSDLAPQFFADPDSVVVFVANPAATTSLLAPPAPAPTGLVASLMMFSPSWNFAAMKITVINNADTPPDTMFWHQVVWADPLVFGNHGFAIAFSRNNTFSINPINTTSFDASGATSGAAAGEFHVSTASYWEDDSKGGRYQVTSQTYPGGFTSITTGPYLGGQSRSGQQFGRVNNSKFNRLLGAENPAQFTVSFDYRGTGLPAVEILCVFPLPCTSNTLRELRAR